MRAASLWGLAGLALSGVFLLWYRASLPDSARAMLGALVTPGLGHGLVWAPALTAAYFAALALKPSGARLVPGLLAIALIFSGVWSLERVREMIRKPYVIPDYMYSNQIVGNDMPAKGVKSELARFDTGGILKSAPFVPADLREITDANRLQAGRLIALIECSACHTLDQKGLRPLPERLRRLGAASPADVEAVVDGLAAMQYMPPFAGTEDEKHALVLYLSSLTRAK